MKKVFETREFIGNLLKRLRGAGAGDRDGTRRGAVSRVVAGALVLVAGFAALAGCASTVSVQVAYTQPARLDLGAAKRLAVDSNDGGLISRVSQALSSSGMFTVASADELQAWKQWRSRNERLMAEKAKQDPAAKAAPADLSQGYQDNVAKADISYQGKFLRLDGTIKDFGNSKSGRYYLILNGAGSESINVYFGDMVTQSDIAQLNKGQAVTLYGTCLGYNAPSDSEYEEILRLLGGGRAVNIADASFPVTLEAYPGAIGAVISASASARVKDDSKTEKRTVTVTDAKGLAVKDANGKTVTKEETYTVYSRAATANLSYEVVSAKDLVKIGAGERTGTAKTNWSEDRSHLTSAEQLKQQALSSPISSLIADLVPTKQSASIRLEQEKDNKEAKKEMSAADKLAKSGDYAGALAAYGAIYAKYKNFAAGYNQAALTEVTAGTAAAIKVMEELVKAFPGNAVAQGALSGMKQRNASNEAAAAQRSQ